jgi:hypothetical protein
MDEIGLVARLIEMNEVIQQPKPINDLVDKFTEFQTSFLVKRYGNTFKQDCIADCYAYQKTINWMYRRD